MVSVYDLKPRFQALLRPLARALVRLGATPNHITCAALLGSLAVGACLAWRGPERLSFALLPTWLFVRMALNALDGMMAREHDMTSPAGAVLNEVGDVVSDAVLYVPLAFLAPAALWSAVAFALAGGLTEVAGLHAQALGAGRRYDGPMGKSDRAFVVGALGLFAAIWPQTTGAWPIVLASGAALGVWTTARRAAKALTILRERA
ncbi:MAG: CDP-alcohol phosphatidyltransferase family protein [Planctomycetes bacterium]|nr:CDP-alcohol phosphatidyltransferase family protein [Planctomycetota bacterium]